MDTKTVNYVEGGSFGEVGGSLYWVMKNQQADRTFQNEPHREVKTSVSEEKWFLKEQHGMVCNLLVLDYIIENIIPLFGMLASIFLIQDTISEKIWILHPYQPVTLVSFCKLVHAERDW